MNSCAECLHARQPRQLSESRRRGSCRGRARNGGNGIADSPRRIAANVLGITAHGRRTSPMTAPLKTVEADTAAVMPEIGQRARKAARVLALAPAAQKDKALAAIAEAIRARKADILAANAEDMAEAKRDGANAAFLDRLALDDKRVAAMADGVDVVRDARRSGRRGHRALDAAERHDDRARARAARRRRHHLREPPERHRRRRRALPQGRQRRDPARRLGEPALEPRHPCRDRRRACARPACRRTRSSWCRRATAPRSA